MDPATIATLAAAAAPPAVNLVKDLISAVSSKETAPQQKKKNGNKNKNKNQNRPNNYARNSGRGRGSRGRGGRQNRGRYNRPYRAQPLMKMESQAVPIRSNFMSKDFHTPKNGRRPLGERYNGGQTFTGEFHIAQIQTKDAYTTGSDLVVCYVNPKFFKDTRIAYDSQVWQRYFFEEIELIYIPTVAATTAGSIVVGILDNVAIAPPPQGLKGVQQLSNLKGSFFTQVAMPAQGKHRFHVPTAPYLCTADMAFDALGTLSTQGRIIIKAASDLTANTTYGMIKMRYKIHFYEELYPVSEYTYNVKANFELASYVYETSHNMVYIKSPTNADAFPHGVDATLYNIILNEDITLTIIDWDRTAYAPVTYKAGTTWIGMQKGTDTNITYIYRTEADLVAGPHEALQIQSAMSDSIKNFLIISRGAYSPVVEEETRARVAEMNALDARWQKHLAELSEEEEEDDDYVPEDEAEYLKFVPVKGQPLPPLQQPIEAPVDPDYIKYLEHKYGHKASV